MGGHLPGGLLHRKGANSNHLVGPSHQNAGADDSPPSELMSAPYKGSKVWSYRRSKDCLLLPRSPHRVHGRGSSRSGASLLRNGRILLENAKKKSHYYREQRRERSRSYGQAIAMAGPSWAQQAPEGEGAGSPQDCALASVWTPRKLLALGVTLSGYSC